MPRASPSSVHRLFQHRLQEHPTNRPPLAEGVVRRHQIFHSELPPWLRVRQVVTDRLIDQVHLFQRCCFVHVSTPIPAWASCHNKSPSLLRYLYWWELRHSTTEAGAKLRLLF